MRRIRLPCGLSVGQIDPNLKCIHGNGNGNDLRRLIVAKNYRNGEVVANRVIIQESEMRWPSIFRYNSEREIS